MIASIVASFTIVNHLAQTARDRVSGVAGAIIFAGAYVDTVLIAATVAGITVVDCCAGAV